MLFATLQRKAEKKVEWSGDCQEEKLDQVLLPFHLLHQPLQTTKSNRGSFLWQECEKENKGFCLVFAFHTSLNQLLPLSWNREGTCTPESVDSPDNRGRKDPPPNKSLKMKRHLSAFEAISQSAQSGIEAPNLCWCVQACGFKHLGEFCHDTLAICDASGRGCKTPLIILWW